MFNPSISSASFCLKDHIARVYTEKLTNLHSSSLKTEMCCQQSDYIITNKITKF
jgi:hypothetical protein